MQLEEIIIYPIKSIAGVSAQEAYAGERGFDNDRRWMLIDSKSRFITQRQHHKLALVQLEIHGETMELTHADLSRGSTIVPLNVVGTARLHADIWDDKVQVIWPGLEADAWFSDYLDQPCRLVYLPDESVRRVDPDYVSDNVNTSLSDGYPYLLTNRASLRDIELRSGVSLSMTRFRPNLVVDSGAAFDEDHWKALKVGEVRFRVVKPCARCVLTTIDPLTGQAGHEPLQTLSTYRKTANKILFGQNMIALRYGHSRVGQTLAI